MGGACRSNAPAAVARRPRWLRERHGYAPDPRFEIEEPFADRRRRDKPRSAARAIEPYSQTAMNKRSVT